MTDNFREFSIALDRFADREVPKAVQALTQKVSLQALRSVVLKSPVDTGRFRANWQTALSTPAGGTLERTDANGGATIMEGAGVIASARPFDAVWLSNNLPYGPALEDGSSRQAPSGMVAVTVAEIRSQFRG